MMTPSGPPSASRDKQQHDRVVRRGQWCFLFLYLVALVAGWQDRGLQLLAMALLLLGQRIFEHRCFQRWIAPHQKPPRGPLRLRKSLHGVDLEDREDKPGDR